MCIADEADQIRTTAGSIISAIVKQSKLENWPNLIEDLVGGLSSPSAVVIDGILSTLAIICEDYAITMCSPVGDTLGGPERCADVLNVLIPKLLQFLSVDVSHFRRHALRCLNQFIPYMPAALRNHFDTYIQVS
jgi:transportin-1